MGSHASHRPNYESSTIHHGLKIFVIILPCFGHFGWPFPSQDGPPGKKTPNWNPASINETEPRPVLVETTPTGSQPKVSTGGALVTLKTRRPRRAFGKRPPAPRKPKEKKTGRSCSPEDAAAQIRPHCGTSAEQVRNKCGTSAEQVRHKYGTSAAQVRHKFGASAAQVRHKCGTNAAAQVRHKCGASAEHSADRVWNGCGFRHVVPVGWPATTRRRQAIWQAGPPTQLTRACCDKS